LSAHTGQGVDLLRAVIAERIAGHRQERALDDAGTYLHPQDGAFPDGLAAASAQPGADARVEAARASPDGLGVGAGDSVELHGSAPDSNWIHSNLLDAL
jgi:hypothetical protein